MYNAQNSTAVYGFRGQQVPLPMTTTKPRDWRVVCKEGQLLRLRFLKHPSEWSVSIGSNGRPFFIFGASPREVFYAKYRRARNAT